MWLAEDNLLLIHQCWWLYEPDQLWAWPSGNAESHLGKENKTLECKIILQQYLSLNNAHLSDHISTWFKTTHLLYQKNIFYLSQLFPHLKCISFHYMLLAFSRTIIIIRFLKRYSMLFQMYSEQFSLTTNIKLTPINNYLFSFTRPACLTCCWHNMKQHLNLTGEQSPTAVGILPPYQISPIIQHHLAHCSLRYP